MRCAEHGLAVGPDGGCVLCRRARRATKRPPTFVWKLVGGAVLVMAALVGAWTLAARRVILTEAAPTASASIAPELVAPPIAAPPPEPHRVPMPTEARPLPSLSVPAVSLGGADAATDAPPPTAAELGAALRATPVLMYTTQWCPVCRRARQYFAQQGIRWRERDIDASREARDELVRRTGRTSVPTIELDGVLLPPGFDEPELGQALVNSLERRLGIRGLELRRVR